LLIARLDKEFNLEETIGISVFDPGRCSATSFLCAAGTGRLPEQSSYRIGVSMEDFASLARKCRLLHHRK
jgi:hypothetical protein